MFKSSLTPQRDTATVLTHLLNTYTEAPSVSWSISHPTYSMPDLRGQACSGDDQADRDVVVAWAIILGVDVVKDRKGSEKLGFWTQVAAEAHINGVYVQVWAMVDQLPADENAEVAA